MTCSAWARPCSLPSSAWSAWRYLPHAMGASPSLLSGVCRVRAEDPRPHPESPIQSSYILRFHTSLIAILQAIPRFSVLSRFPLLSILVNTLPYTRFICSPDENTVAVQIALVSRYWTKLFTWAWALSAILTIPFLVILPLLFQVTRSSSPISFPPRLLYWLPEHTGANAMLELCGAWNASTTQDLAFSAVCRHLCSIHTSVVFRDSLCANIPVSSVSYLQAFKAYNVYQYGSGMYILGARTFWRASCFFVIAWQPNNVLVCCNALGACSIVIQHHNVECSERREDECIECAGLSCSSSG